MREKIDKAISELHEDGTLSELAKQFYQEDASVKSDKESIEVDVLDI